MRTASPRATAGDRPTPRQLPTAGLQRPVELSVAYRQEHPLCEYCERAGKLTPSECVDHRIACDSSDENFWLESNFAAACWSCHSKKTNLVDRGFGRRRG